MPRANTANQRSPKGPPLSDFPVQRTVPANSVFALSRGPGAAPAAATPERQRGRVELPSLDTLVIHTDRPLTERLTHKAVGEFWASLWARLQPGHSVDLTIAQAKSFGSWAKKNGCDFSVRKLDDSTSAIWRNA